MSRRSAREAVFTMIYEYGYDQNAPDEIFLRRKEQDRLRRADETELPALDLTKKDEDYVSETLHGVCLHLDELDAYIQKYAVDWRFDRISRAAAAILRLAMYEIIYAGDVPPASAANEAVELAKSYCDEATAAFVNGILGTFIKKELT